MGGDPAKIRRSLDRHMDAYYEQGMFTNGLSTIQADELHSYEEGIQVLGQSLLLDFGNPKELERAMATAAALESITGVNRAGHRHIRTSYYSGTQMALEGVWGWQKPSGFLALHPAIALVDYNGAPRVKKWLLELADGLLAHYDPRTRTLRVTLEFATDNDAVPADALGLQAPDRAWPLLWAAYRWTGDKKYIAPLLDIGPRALSGISANALDYLGLRDAWRAQLSAPEWMSNRSDSTRHLLWQTTGDVRYLESLYEDQVRAARLREYINTEGSLWIDRVQVPMNEIQRARLGGVALVRNMIVPGHAVSWEFPAGDDERVGILVPDATPRRLTVVGYNLGPAPIEARMSTWDIEPGSWEVTMDTRREPASGALANPVTSTRELERSGTLPVTFAPGIYTVVQLRQLSPGVPYWQRPDLGIGREDVKVLGRTVRVTVHSLGAVAAPASRVVIRDRDGRELAHAAVGAIAAPAELEPRALTVALSLPIGASAVGASVSVEPARGAREITRVNNTVTLR